MQCEHEMSVNAQAASVGISPLQCGQIVFSMTRSIQGQRPLCAVAPGQERVLCITDNLPRRSIRPHGFNNKIRYSRASNIGILQLLDNNEVFRDVIRALDIRSLMNLRSTNRFIYHLISGLRQFREADARAALASVCFTRTHKEWTLRQLHAAITVQHCDRCRNTTTNEVIYLSVLSKDIICGTCVFDAWEIIPINDTEAELCWDLPSGRFHHVLQMQTVRGYYGPNNLPNRYGRVRQFDNRSLIEHATFELFSTARQVSSLRERQAVEREVDAEVFRRYASARQTRQRLVPLFERATRRQVSNGLVYTTLIRLN